MKARRKKWRIKPLKKRENKKKRVVRTIFLIIAILIILGGIGASGMLIWLKSNMPSPEKLLEREVPLSTKIYDRAEKQVLYEIFSEERRTLVKLEELPPYLIKATITAEDRNFFTHPGFNFKSMVRAIIVDIFKGGKLQGGSTITQQFIKNAFLTPEKAILRKIKELFLAYQIEQKFSKEEILQMYLNEIPYGGTAYGVEAAASIYFQKSAKNLSLDEAALLAALPKAPTYYSPWGDHQEELINRRDYILNSMVEENYITEEESEEAKKINTLEKIKRFQSSITAPHFVMYIKQILVEKYGHRLVEQGGLKIITTLDLEAQKKAEEVIEEKMENVKKWGGNNAALVSIDVKTGEILAMVGSANFLDETINGQVNVATSLRQPGSSFKPIVYAAAFEKGYTPDTILFDVKTDFGPQGDGKPSYIPSNYDLKERGPVTMRQALAGSLNIPSIKTAYLTRPETIVELAQRMGYSTITDPKKYGISLGLGAADVTLLEHASAFSIFAREGERIPITAILEVKDNKGKILEKKEENDLENFQVISQNTARTISDILSDNESRALIFGQNPNFLLPDRPVAVKTGTTNEFRNAWALGYTPEIVTGVWVGNTDNSKMKQGADGSQVALPIWHNFMAEITKRYSPTKFTPPQIIKTEKPILNGEIPEDVTLKIDKISGKLATEFTPPELIEEKTFKAYHSILFWVDRDNPQGPIPLNPANDPQFLRWEEAIKIWLEKQKEENKAEFSLAPSQYDDIHIPANKPQLKILSPENNQNIDSQYLEVSLNASAPLGIDKISCFIDEIEANSLIISDQNPPFILPVNLAGLKSGSHNLTILVKDKVGNKTEETITINLTIYLPQKIEIDFPKNNQQISQNDFPLDIILSLPLGKFKSLRLWQEDSSGKESLVSTLFSPAPGMKQILLWPKSNPGEYNFWAEGETEKGEIISSEKIKITIY